MISRRSLLGFVAGTGAGALAQAARFGEHRAPEAAPRPASPARPAPAISPLALGAVSALDLIPEALRADVRAGRSRVDLAPHLNPALARIGAAAGGGTIFFPAGTYPISSLDLGQRAGSEAGMTLIGAGPGQTILRATAPGRVMLDATGRNYLSLVDLEFQSNDVIATCALLLARGPGRESIRNRVQNVRMRGSFAVAAAVSIAAESNSWTGCLFENASAASRHACFLTASDPARLGLPQSATAGSNTDNVMTDCEFYTPYDGAAPVRFVGAAAYTMLACSVIAGSARGTRLVTYETRQSVFAGPVNWHSPHLEVFGADAVVHALRGAELSYYRGINSYGGNYQLGSGTVLLGVDPALAGRPVVENTTWTVPTMSSGTRDMTVSLYALIDSSLAIRTSEGVGDVDIAGFTANAHVAAARIRVAQKAVGAAACL